MCFLLTTSSLASTLMIVCTSVYIYIYRERDIDIYNCVFGLLISDITCNYVSADWGRDGLWWPVLLGHWMSYTGCWQALLVMYWLVFGMLFLFLTSSLGCFVHGLCFSNNGLNKLPWTSYLHAILRITSRGVSGLATDSPCGVWGRGWTTCLLHDCPLFGSLFKMRVGM